MRLARADLGEREPRSGQLRFGVDMLSFSGLGSKRAIVSSAA